MNSTTTILVTGVASYWARRVAETFLTQPRYRVIGIDSAAPSPMLPGMQFVKADANSAMLVGLLQAEKVDVVVHTNDSAAIEHDDAMYDDSIMRTIKLLSACAQAGVKKIVLKSSTLVYGAAPDNNHYLPEQAPLRGSGIAIRRLIEIERFCAGFRQKEPQVDLTILRFANIVGPTAPTSFNQYLNLPVQLVITGYNPLFQVIHEDDVVAALAFAAGLKRPTGVFNIGLSFVMPLRKIIGLNGTIPLSILPFATGISRSLAKRGGVDGAFPFAPDFLRYSWLGDVSRMHDVLGFVPLISAEKALKNRRNPIPKQKIIYKNGSRPSNKTTPSKEKTV